jgi:hypothetical protein
MEMDYPANSPFRYLPARRVRCGVFNGKSLRVVNDSAQSIGNLDGLIIDPSARKARFVVIQPRGFLPQQPRLVPLPGARLDPEREALLVEGPLSGYERFEASRFPEMTDEDVLTAVFAA